MRMPLSEQLKRIAVLVLLLFTASVTGYIVIEGFSLVDAVYMTVLAVSTVGFGEVHPLSPVGRVFTIGVIVAGVGTAAYLFSLFTEYVIAGELAGTLRQGRMMRAISQLRNHYIVCGFGRVGEQVASEMAALHMPLVVVEREPAAIERLERRGLPYVRGNAAEDETLMAAGIEHAVGLITVLNADSDNVFVALSARALNKDLQIVARATTEAAERKLRQAGADRVVSPYVMAGNHIVSLLVHPNVVEFLHTTMRTPQYELWLEEITIAPDSPLVGKTLHEMALRETTGANVLVILRGAEHQTVDWSPELALAAGDVLIVMGRQEQLQALARLARDTRGTRPSRLRELVTQVE
ncbi:MAG: potassium channel protein [Chloroflexi bacterium]|nr:potassium channel protein [Chloroflexota bacterium]